MSNLVQIFNNEEFGQVRSTEIDGKIYFVASDIAKALGYQNTSEAIKYHCKGVAKCYIPTNGGKQKMNVITEGDIYRLAANSELPGAEKFESWIFDDILPTIRKHGAYLTPEKIEEALLNPDTLIRLASDLKAEREARQSLETKVEQDKPKVLFAESVTASKNSILIRELAKVLQQNGIETGEKRLYEYLRENGYLIRKRGSDYNTPTQKAMAMGLFEVKKTTVTHSDGNITVNTTPKVTGKGQLYFINKLKGIA